ncbi:hypothetical protein ABMA28_009598 [Loxostege sticticalis]|uniref:FHA domain-containing protein n=1 Tax=Loxostege sticticalis TaxID=481309 RepID=A0ABD0SAT6_LOXSC
MSGGRLVVLDRLGREVKRYPLASGLATLGSDPRCDIRVMLPTVSGHHATVVVHTHQTVVRNVGDGETLVNGQAVSVAALRHGDLLTVGDRSLRWEYAEPSARRPLAAEPALVVPRRTMRGRRRGSHAAPAPARSPALQLALELQHRASMPGNAGGKQVAIVQPQRRDTTDTPLRLAVLRRAQSAQKPRVTKIEAPREIDHTKQAALLLMTGHTPKSKGPSPRTSSAKNTPSFVIKKHSPVRKTPRSSRGSLRTPASAQTKTPSTATRSSKRSSGGQTVSILEISDSTPSTIRSSSASRRSRAPLSPAPLSPLLPTPRKSALKDPAAKNTSRKTESIKFDLSNLEHHTEDRSEILTVGETTRAATDSASEDELTLHYSDTSSVQSPSPRKSIHSRSSRMLEKSLGTSATASPTQRSRSTLTAVTPDSPRRKSSRGTLILQKALDTSDSDSRYSRRTTKSLTDRTADATVASAFKTRTLSPRTPNQNLETYSIVDLVSIDSNESGRSTSVYNSAGSANSSATAFGTPQNSSGRRTRSTIDPNTLIGSSTPYVKPTRSSSLKSQSSRKSSIRNTSNVSARSSGSARRSKSLTTPENSEDTRQHISVNSTKISRASKSRSRISDSDLMLISSSDNSQLEDASPRSSKRVGRSTKSDSPASTRKSSRRSGGDVTPSSNEKDEGISTPENRHSPEEVGTPVLSIQSLLNSSQSSFASISSTKKGRASYSKRKTIGVIRSEPRPRRTGAKSKSLNFTARRGLLRLSKDSSLASDKTDEGAPKTSNEKMVTPKSAVKLVQEAVKNKHSTAKKPQSKRSIIDNLDESDIVKQLFNSPVKRKLSQSMTEFSRKQLFEEDDDIVVARRPTRNTIAVTGRTPDNSILDHTEAITPEVFVSPISTPNNSPNLTGIKRLFRKHTPDNDLRNVKGVKGLLRTPQTRRSIKNDLTNISGVKQVFAKSPKNRLSDVRVKEVFAEGPKNDLRRVSGVKSLFQSEKKRKSPRNDLSDVRGVKLLFQQNSPKNDLRRVSGVKRALQRGSPRNDLSDVRGVKKMFKGQKERNDLNDVSGVEELFNESNTSVRDSESLFDQLIGKPPIKAVYSKSFVKKPAQKPKTRGAKSLHASIDVITNNVEEWIEQELQKRLHKEDDKRSKHNATKELQRLATDTVEGAEPLRTSRVRNSTVLSADVSGKRSASEVYSARKLPIKKRSLVDVSAEGAAGRKVSLPIKKRLVVHSTPVKGRSRLTMNASELGRVSPIAPADTSLRSESTLAMPEPKPTRSTRLTKVATEAEVSKEVTKSPLKASTSKSSPKQAKAASPRARTTRARNNKTDNSLTNTKKRRTSLVISKKSPVMSPKPAPRTRRGKVEQKADSAKVEPKPTKNKVAKKGKASVQPSPPKSKAPKSPTQVSPKKTRATRKQEVKPATPKRNTRAKVQKATVVVGKPSPQLKPQAKSKAKVEKEAPKTKAAVTESPKTRTRETRAKADSPRKSRKTAANQNTTEEVETKSKRRKVEPPKESLEPARTRRTVESEPKGKRNKADNESKKPEPEPEKKGGKGRKTQVIVEENPEPKRTRKTQDDAKKTDSKDSLKPTRSRKKLETQESVQSEPTTRTRRGKVTENTVIPEVKTRKRKSTSENEIPAKVSKGNAKEVVETKARKGRKTTIETTETEKGNVRQKRSVVKASKVEISEQQKQDGSTVENVRTVRSKKVVVTAVKTTTAAKEAKSAKSGKAAPKETETKTNTRRKKTEPSPVKKATPVKSPAAKRTRKVASPPARTRATRNQPQEAATKATGRSRRR